MGAETADRQPDPARARQDHDDRDPEDHGEGREKRRGDRRLPEVQEGPSVRRHRLGCDRLHDLRAGGYAERAREPGPLASTAAWNGPLP